MSNPYILSKQSEIFIHKLRNLAYHLYNNEKDTIFVQSKKGTRLVGKPIYM